ncbi:MAG: hydantoinase/oxoprolinase family protein [Gammaproteobacteria bacterium]|nr:hydantoinase/oxoprolinase family protein [Gammaproteobacteria bacterium]
MLVIGIDVGGTFTDVVCSDGATTWKAKSPTIPDNFGAGVIKGCELIAGQFKVALGQMLGDVERFGLGTTAVTNVLATRQGLRVGLLTTAGFEKHLHLARGSRVNVDGWLEMPWNPVGSADIVGIEERIDREGNIVEPLDEAAVERAVHRLCVEREVEALAVSFLWSCRNSVHEKAAADIARRAHPQLPVFSGVELHPIQREYERTTMAVLNAYTARALDGVEDLERDLRALGLKAPLLLLHSGGGAMTVSDARKSPLGLASSGPAAGTVAAGELARVVGCEDAMCCDMGGTSTDVSVVVDGTAERRQQAIVNGLVTGVSSIDVESIGAGGGSVAWVDSRGMLRVGPQSARAIPGPVCYGRGGTVPTITDANLLLGYISAESFSSGGIELDVEAAAAACESLGAPIGFSAMQVAHGIREIAIAEMEKAILARLASSGHDPRKLSIVSIGGSGSLFVPTIAKQLGFKSTISSEFSSVLSAYGAASADIRYETVLPVDRVLPLQSDYAAGFEGLRRALSAQLKANGVPDGKREYHFEADVRLYRQKTSITLPLDEARIDSGWLSQTFKALYAERYGPAAYSETTMVELSTLRVVGIGQTTRARLPDDARCAESAGQPAPSAARDVWMDRHRPTEVPVHHLDALRAGQVLEGPALIDTSDTTIWTPPGMFTHVRRNRSLETLEV